MASWGEWDVKKELEGERLEVTAEELTELKRVRAGLLGEREEERLGENCEFAGGVYRGTGIADTG